MAGAVITFTGVAVTVLINYVFIPRFSFMACAWATFMCYGSMMAVSYIWGQKVYHVPYAWKKLLAYLVIVVILFFIHQGLIQWLTGNIAQVISAVILLSAYIVFVGYIEKKELQSLPFIGKRISAT